MGGEGQVTTGTAGKEVTAGQEGVGGCGREVTGTETMSNEWV